MRMSPEEIFGKEYTNIVDGKYISFLQKVADSIPKYEESLDPDSANKLAGAFLRAADICSDLIGKLSRLSSEVDVEVKSAKGQAVMNEMANEKLSATAAIQTYGNDLDYQQKARDHAVHLSILQWLTRKYDCFIKAHHYCKEYYKITMSVDKMSNWEDRTSDI